MAIRLTHDNMVSFICHRRSDSLASTAKDIVRTSLANFFYLFLLNLSTSFDKV